MALCPHECGMYHLSIDRDVPYGTFTPISLDGSICTHTRRSNGGNTHILYCVVLRDGFTAGEIMLIRASLGDDPERIVCDRARYDASGDARYIMGVLFDGANCGPWEMVR